MSLASTRERDTVLVRRPVRVERVPDGTPIELATGTRAQVTQALGSSFTLVVDGKLVRLPGRDADAIDVRFFEKPYVLVPGKKAEKGYVLLRETLRASKKIGIARVVIRPR